MAEPKLKTTQEERQYDADDGTLCADLCRDIDTLLARVRELETKVASVEQARTPLQADNTRLTLRNRELEAEREDRTPLWRWGRCGNCNWPQQDDDPEYPVHRTASGYWEHFDDARFVSTCGATFQREYAYMQRRVKELEAEREGAAVVKLETLMAVAGALYEFGPKAPSHTCGAPGAACDFECSVFAGWSAVRREVAAAIRAAGGER